MEYLLKHKDITVAGLLLDKSASIIRVDELLQPEHVPVGVAVRKGAVDKVALNEWWLGRSIPMYRQGIRSVLEVLDMTLPQKLLEKSFGLSLSDQYWICPQSADISWSDVNFFTNHFSKDFGDILFGKEADSKKISLMSPDNTSDGWLKKRWTIVSEKRYLVKGGSGPFQQETYNEVIASAIMRRLGIPHVPYTLLMQDEEPYSVCEDFVTLETELISAWYVMQTMKKPNNVSIHQHYLNCCKELGIPGIQQAVDEMITLDYLIVNEDRHQNNFGVLRNADTLEWLGAAPIFDSGSSLWFDTQAQLIRPLAPKANCKPFKNSHAEQIKLVSSFDWLELSKLKGLDDEVLALVEGSTFIDADRYEAIMTSLTRRVEILQELQMSHKVGISGADLTCEVQENIAYSG